MAATTETEEQVTLKLVVNKDTNKVLFAEAGKDFVDVLCSFLTLPLGTIARLLGKESEMEQVTVGCLNSLYLSVENLDKECLKTATCKEMLLQPRNSSEEYCRSLKLNIDDTEPMKYYVCSAFGPCMSMNLSTFKNQICPCEHLLDREVSVETCNLCDGFVNHGATYIITDNLIVVPNSVDSSFDLLTMHESFGIQNTSSVKEMTVNVNKEKVFTIDSKIYFKYFFFSIYLVPLILPSFLSI